jgi:hypothetical protein
VVLGRTEDVFSGAGLLENPTPQDRACRKIVAAKGEGRSLDILTIIKEEAILRVSCASVRRCLLKVRDSSAHLGNDLVSPLFCSPKTDIAHHSRPFRRNDRWCGYLDH